ncbi:MAG: hypothetical protein AAF202_03420 [Pseudomonadota bacterium]
MSALLGPLLIACLSLPAIADQPDSSLCGEEMRGVPPVTSIEIDQETGEAFVSYLWYPLTMVFVTHSKLEIDGRVYDTLGRYQEKTTLEKVERGARQEFFSAFVRFKFPIPKEKADEMIEGLGSLRDNYSTCSAGTCEALGQNEVFYVPRGIRQVPYLAAIYMALAKISRLNENIQIEFVGRRGAKHAVFITFVYQVPFELVGTPFISAFGQMFQGTEWVIGQLVKIAPKIKRILKSFGIGRARRNTPLPQEVVTSQPGEAGSIQIDWPNPPLAENEDSDQPD